MPIKFEVSNTFTYPDYRWVWIAEIPEEAAYAWAEAAVPTSNLGGMSNTPIATIRQKRAQWLNKLAVVVSDDHRGQLAIYKHDFGFYLIKYLTERS